MSSPASVIHARVEAWRLVLAAGGTVKEKLPAGKASVAVTVLPNVAGDLDQGLRVLEQRLIAAANAAQSPGTKFSVEVSPTDLLGLSAAAEIRGPAHA